ncbi:MAG: hypothetical protein SFX74_00990 [Fimbriimonadaceae bacterium]|nr:hypothetical protein [Fimbriimonadaceae bacterium]
MFHVFCITAWALPNRAELMSPDARPVGTDALLVENGRHVKNQDWLRTYLFVTGFWQYWDMFSPNPAQRDFYGTATVTYSDGSTQRYQYPRIYLLSIPEKYPAERYRKFYERAHLEDSGYCWAQFAARIAQKCDTKGSVRPVKVVLRRHWRDVAKPGQRQFRPYTEFEYFTYRVRKMDLEPRS